MRSRFGSHIATLLPSTIDHSATPLGPRRENAACSLGKFPEKYFWRALHHADESGPIPVYANDVAFLNPLPTLGKLDAYRNHALQQQKQEYCNEGREDYDMELDSLGSPTTT